MIIFFGLITAILAFVWGYVWQRLVVSSNLPQGVVIVLAAILILTFLLQVLRWIDRLNFDLKPKLLFVTYFFMGFMIHLFFAAVFKDVLLLSFGFFYPALFEQQAYFNLLCFVVCLMLHLWGVKTAVEGPVVKTVKVEKARGETTKIKIAQISDLHVSSFIKKKYVQSVVEKVNALKPDIIVITGDMVDGEVETLFQDVEPLRKLKSKYGTYYVTGNHEYYWNPEAWFLKAKELGFKPLFNHGEQINVNGKNIWIAGVPDITSVSMIPGHSSDPLQAIKGAQDGDFKILLAHQPKSYTQAAKAGFDLMLCGHTHNGQFFPINFVVGWFNLYARGLNKTEKTWVYVNAGTGYWGPAQRLGVPSEITEMDLSF